MSKIRGMEVNILPKALNALDTTLCMSKNSKIHKVGFENDNILYLFSSNFIER